MGEHDFNNASIASWKDQICASWGYSDPKVGWRITWWIDDGDATNQIERSRRTASTIFNLLLHENRKDKVIKLKKHKKNLISRDKHTHKLPSIGPDLFFESTVIGFRGIPWRFRGIPWALPAPKQWQAAPFPSLTTPVRFSSCHFKLMSCKGTSDGF